MLDGGAESAGRCELDQRVGVLASFSGTIEWMGNRNAWSKSISLCLILRQVLQSRPEETKTIESGRLRDAWSPSRRNFEGVEAGFLAVEL